MVACDHGHFDIAKFLMDHLADVNKENRVCFLHTFHMIPMIGKIHTSPQGLREETFSNCISTHTTWCKCGQIASWSWKSYLSRLRRRYWQHSTIVGMDFKKGLACISFISKLPESKFFNLSLTSDFWHKSIYLQLFLERKRRECNILSPICIPVNI